jgi:hypothetical protein
MSGPDSNAKGATSGRGFPAYVRGQGGYGAVSAPRARTGSALTASDSPRWVRSPTELIRSRTDGQPI